MPVGSKAVRDREELRRKGQFWTPRWIAEAMVAYAIKESDHIFDPAVGNGAFFRAAKTVSEELGKEIAFYGMELDPKVLGELRGDPNIQIGDFILNPPQRRFKAIVANPPYIRHHRLSPDTKRRVREIGKAIIGKPLDGRAGLHVYFLLISLRLLEEGGRLAFIVPADVCEGVFSSCLWNYISRNYRVDAVVTFEPDATPFPDVDVNPLILMIKNAEPQDEFFWARCLKPSARLKEWVLSEFECEGEDLIVHRRRLSEALLTGLSKPPITVSSEFKLGDFARVMRGLRLVTRNSSS